MPADEDEFTPANWANLPVGWQTSRSDTGCATSTSTTVTDTAAVAGDLHQYISGGSIPAGATITVVNVGVGYTISAAATGTASSLTFIVSTLQVVTAGASCSVLGAYGIHALEPLQCQQITSSSETGGQITETTSNLWWYLAPSAPGAPETEIEL